MIRQCILCSEGTSVSIYDQAGIEPNCDGSYIRGYKHM